MISKGTIDVENWFIKILIFALFQNFAVSNKFSYLLDSEEVGSGQDSE